MVCQSHRTELVLLHFTRVALERTELRSWPEAAQRVSGCALFRDAKLVIVIDEIIGIPGKYAVRRDLYVAQC